MYGGRIDGTPRVTPTPALTAFANALRSYVAGEFTEAALGFRACRDLCAGTDGPSEFYLRLAERFGAEPRPPDWDGVVAFETK